MPTPTTDHADLTVLVTGINGYIATHIALQLLHKGYRVRGTSRSASARSHLLSGVFKGFEAQYEHYEVPDIVAEGAFDEAVRGVYAIIHTASPVDFTLKTVDEYFGPAIGGNVSILNSTRLAGPQLKSFVVTSSIAAIVDRWRLPPDHAYSESDWNESGEAVARKEFSAPVAYGASKAAAERALWNWVEGNQPTFAVTAVNPAVVTGPPVSWPSSPGKLNTTLLPIWSLYSGEAKTMPPQIGGAGYIDVRDVARMHIWAVEHPEQSRGRRYLLANGKAPPQAAADILRKHFPDREILRGEPGKGYTEDYGFVEGESSAVSTRACEALGVKRFIMFDQSVLDTVAAFEKQWPGVAQNFKKES